MSKRHRYHKQIIRQQRPAPRILRPVTDIRETVVPLAEIAKEAKERPTPGPTSLSEQERDEIRQGRIGKRTVVIFGWAERTRGLLDWDGLSPEIQVWGLNECYADPSGFFREERATAWFQIHPRWDFTRRNNHNDPNHFEWLKKIHNFRIWMIKKFPDVPQSEEYPIEDICSAYGPNKRRARYFKSTAATMLALAIHQKFERVEIYGVEMTQGDDYVKQRANLEFWLGVAMGRGIEIYTPTPSALSWWNENPLYGFEAKPRLNVTHLELRRKMHEDKAKEFDFEMAQLQGEMRKIQQQMAQPGIGAGRKMKLKDQLEMTEGRMIEVAQKSAWTKGNRNAFDWMIRETKLAGEVQLKLDEGVDPNDLDWGISKEEPSTEQREGASEEEPAAEAAVYSNRDKCIAEPAPSVEKQ